MESLQYFIIIIISTLLSGILTWFEITFSIIQREYNELNINSDTLISGLKKSVKTNPGKYIVTRKIADFLFFAISVYSFTILLFPSFNNQFKSQVIIFLLIILISSIVFLLFGKLLPRVFYSILPGTLLIVSLFFVTFLSFLLYPFVLVVSSVSKAFLRDEENLKPEFSGTFYLNNNIDWLSKEKKETGTEKKEIVETEVQLFKNALDFSKVKLREIMVPRTEIEMLELNANIEELRQRFVETGYSRIIFYDGNTDNIVGYVHSSVIFKNPESFKPFIKNVLIVPETMPANKLLSTFIREHRSIAIVVDEFGGTSGMVTTEDILEEIFGEIEDEHDTTDIIEKQINENEFIFSGRSEIDLINEKYRINLPETEDFETLAGFILFHHESIPKINSVINIGIFQFKILKATNTKIELVKLTINND